MTKYKGLRYKTKGSILGLDDEQNMKENLTP